MNKAQDFSSRLLSLDVFRGITVAAMILVNNPGDWGHIYWPLEHAEWNGCTPSDLIFPFFLFIMGVSLVFSLSSKRDYNKRITLQKVIKRACILFCLGLFLNLFPFFDFAHVRILGVLQRIAMVYLACGMLFLYVSKNSQYFVFAVLLVGYYIVMNFVPVPDFGKPNLDKETNLAAWVDRMILTTNHTWKQSVTWDPEGVLSTFPAIATSLSGMFVAYILKSNSISYFKKAITLLLISMSFLVTAFIFNRYFPINKSLWTSTYVLLTSGLAILFFMVLHYLIEVKKLKLFTQPFVIYGVNAILVFFGSAVVAKLCNIKFLKLSGDLVGLKDWLYQQFFIHHISSPYLASFMGAFTFVIIWYVILWVLYKKNIVIKV